MSDPYSSLDSADDPWRRDDDPGSDIMSDSPHVGEGSSELVNVDDVSAVRESRPRRRGQPLIAWLVIVGITGLSVWATQDRQADPDQNMAEETQLALLEMQGRYFVGAAELSPQSKAQLVTQAQMFNRGSVRERLAAMILIGELGGPEQALKSIQTLDEQITESEIALSESDQDLIDALALLYGEYSEERWDASALSEDQLTSLDSKMGWFAELALSPQQAGETNRAAILSRARTTVFVAVAGVLGMILLGLFGLVALGILISLVIGGELKSSLAWSNHGGIYIEAFAAWMLAFVAFSIIVPLLIDVEANPIVPQYIIGALSLTAVLWPVLRGVPWRSVRKEIGWTGGRQWYLEPFYGFLCYSATLPLLAIAVLFMVVFSGLPLASIDLTPSNAPAHPILLWVRQASGWERLNIVILACVSAPLIEETMFRGFLYRHLREATARMRMSISILFSAVFNGLIFAVIHPQGLIAVPALATLAFGFSMAREWRGSLIAPMTAHAINNSVVSMLLLTLL